MTTKQTKKAAAAVALKDAVVGKAVAPAKVANDAREVWLRRAYILIRAAILPEAPEECAIGWGFPSKRGGQRTGTTIGECWMQTHGLEGDRAILISPQIDDPVRVLGVLVHEMCHAALPKGVGHRHPFQVLAARCGLVAPWTATTESPALVAKLKEMVKTLGDYPKGKLVPGGKKQDTRLIKMTCGCGGGDDEDAPAKPRIIRVSAFVIEQGGITCDLCGEEFKESK